MTATIATTPYTSSTSSAPAMFDAGRQPLATLQFNTPEQKRSVKDRKQTDVFFCPRAVNPWANPAQSPIMVKDVSKPKRSVEVPEQIADVFFSQAVRSSANTTYTLNEVKVENFDDDDDIPIAKLMKIALSSLTTSPSTLKRVPRVKKRAGPMEMAFSSLTTGPSTLKRVPRVNKRAGLMEIALSSLTTGSSTLKRVPRVKKRAGPKDSGDPDDEDLPLSRVRELMINLGRRPAPFRFVPGPFKHTILRPATISMKCSTSNGPFGWHGHVNVASH